MIELCGSTCELGWWRSGGDSNGVLVVRWPVLGLKVEGGGVKGAGTGSDSR
jgi:hypothetical protein